MKKYPPLALLLLMFLICLAVPGIALAGTKNCAACGKPITTGTYIEIEGKTYHADHFCCSRCGQPIGTAPYWTVDGRYFDSTCYMNSVAARCTYCGKPIVGEWITDDSGKYHSSCYYDHVAPRCFACNKPIDGQYFFDEFGQTVCETCKENIHQCSACGKMLSLGSNATHRLPDDRLICADCFKVAISDIDEARKLMEEVRRDLKAEGIEVKGDIGLKLVGKPELATYAEEYLEDRLGVTVYEKAGIFGGLVSFKDFRVYALYGLPRTQLRAVLAHELMHVWLFRNGPADSDRQLCEGSCEYAAFLVLSRNPSEESRFYADRLMKNPDPIYGDGYRKVTSLVIKVGKEGWLEHLREHSSAPW